MGYLRGRLSSTRKTPVLLFTISEELRRQNRILAIAGTPESKAFSDFVFGLRNKIAKLVLRFLGKQTISVRPNNYRGEEFLFPLLTLGAALVPPTSGVQGIEREPDCPANARYATSAGCSMNA